MGWKRINGSEYYYRSVREGDQVRSVYVGPGAVGRAAEKQDAIDRAVRRAERVRLKAERRARWLAGIAAHAGGDDAAAVLAAAGLPDEATSAAELAEILRGSTLSWRRSCAARE